MFPYFMVLTNQQQISNWLDPLSSQHLKWKETSSKSYSDSTERDIVNMVAMLWLQTPPSTEIKSEDV